MFRHILLPTDGSDLSAAAVHQGILFAKVIGANVTCLCVIPQHYMFQYTSLIMQKAFGQATQRVTELEEAFAATIEKGAEIGKELVKAYLLTIERSAKKAGVACNVTVETSDHPYEVIVQVAERAGCDLIMMASHGKRGVKALLLGSETQKVLTHSRIPVLVYR
jgi:nucleotide-binding universal stress UspA family protein